MRFLTIALALIISTWCGSIHAADDGLAQLHARYHCEIVTRLAKLKAAKGPSDRFIIVGEVLRQAHFVQCLFDEAGARMLCEASSGFYTQKDGRPPRYVPTADTIAAVARLGFSTDATAGNFQREMDAHTHEALSKIADLLLATLHEAYGISVTTPIEIKAPLAPLSQKDRARCLPMS